MIVETDVSDYTITAIFSIILPNGEIHPVTFHSHTLTTSELNYNTHDKDLLAIFEAFQKWQHYLEGSMSPAVVVTDHKNLEYFSTTKLLTGCQAHWLEFLSQSNLIICFFPGKLGTKPDALTRHWDVYPKEEDSNYAKINLQNLRPVFTQEQLASSLRAFYYSEPMLRAVGLMDIGQLHEDILCAQKTDKHSSDTLSILSDKTGFNSDTQWSVDDQGLLCYDDCIWVPNSDDLCLQILLNNHNHTIRDIMAKTKHWILSEGITHGRVSIHLSKIIASLV